MSVSSDDVVYIGTAYITVLYRLRYWLHKFTRSVAENCRIDGEGGKEERASAEAQICH